MTDFWPSDESGNWVCVVCSGSMGDDYEPPTCCSGYECGCQGKPTEPNVCSKKCWDEINSDSRVDRKDAYSLLGG